jgi:cardiolipin synthase
MDLAMIGPAQLAAPLVAVDVGTIVSAIVTGLVVIALAAIVVVLATDDRDPSTVLAWLFVILLLPVLGLILYFFIGRNYRRDAPWRQRTRQRMRELTSGALAPILAANSSFSAAVVSELHETPAGRIEATGRSEVGLPPLPAGSVEVYITGEQKFASLLADLGSARRSINLMYLIWEQDELTARVTDVLLERLRAGVQVHILYDWLSCITYGKSELKRLAAAGAQVEPCFKQVWHINYRNHMKIALIDGEIVYTGGMNMGQEYIDGGRRFAVWRDTHVRLTGPAVAPFVTLFASTWLLNGRSEDLATGFMPEPVEHGPGDGVPVQMLHSSVFTPYKAIRDVFIVALANARQRIWIQSPYFVPDEPLITAMCISAASGVDVRFMMTGVPDKKVPFYAAQAYYGQLVRAGVKVYQYEAGFLHAKTVTVDEQVTLIGTCNWDIRSIILHDEVVAVLYDVAIARRHAEQYERDLERCRQVTLADLEGMSGAAKLRNSVLRLFSRLL